MLKYILISFLIITNAYAYTCEEMGYTQTIEDCPDHGLRCPAEPEKMFCCDRCGSTGVFRYNEENCSPDDGLQLAGIQCNEKWSECRSCTSEYKYNKDNCRSPKILAGVQCGNAYTQCIYPSGIGCIPTVGYIYYSDGSCHAGYDDTKEAIGVIVDASKKLMIALDEEKLHWNDGTRTVTDIPDLRNYERRSPDALLDMDGPKNTDIIIAFAQSTGQEHKAAEYCANKTDGNKKWYLPALGELFTLSNSINSIQLTLENLPFGTKVSNSSHHWSSTECSDMYAMGYRPSDGSADYWTKYQYTYIVRCFARF